MKKQSVKAFWNDSTTVHPVERRVIFKADGKPAELVVSILPDQPVPDAARMSEAMTEAAIVDLAGTRPGQTIAPQLVFGTLKPGQHGQEPVITTAAGREVPVVQLTLRDGATADLMDYAAQMKQAQAAIGPAVVAAGDHTVGFLFRHDVLYFYPLLSVTLDEDVASYHEGAGTTTDVIPLLPFQN